MYTLWGGMEFTYKNLLKSCLENISCFDDTPAIGFMENLLANFPEGYKRRFAVGTVDVNTGDFVTLTDKDVPFEEAPLAAMSSSSVPGFFQPRPYKGTLFMDGGTVYNIDATDAVKGCLEEGYAEEDIVVDIYVCGQHTPHGYEVSKKAYENW